MKEIACQFGENNRLSGILTLSSNPNTNKALVLISAGLCANHGPFRLYTEIARKIAALGIHVFRFDLGNIGVSKAAHIHQPLQERTTAEIQHALNYLQSTHHISQFYLGGLCSGAEDSFRYAEYDERVIGLLLIDPFAYKTMSMIGKRLLLKVWRDCLKLYLLTDKNYRLNYKNNHGQELVDYRFINKEESTRILKSLLARHVRFHFIYTSGQSTVFNHHSQFWKMLPQFKNYPFITLDYLPELNHTQLLQDDKNLILKRIEQGFSTVIQGAS